MARTLAAGVFAWAGCGDPHPSADCEHTCERLDTCDLLSTALGGDMVACEARCALSDADLRTETKACVEGVSDVPPDATDLAKWCGDPELAPCQPAAACIRDLYGQSPFAELPSLFVDFTRATDSAGECPGDDTWDPSTTRGPCPANLASCVAARTPETSGSVLSEAAPSWCEELGVSLVTAWVESSAGATSTRVSGCATTPETVGFSRVEPGLVQPVSRVEGALPVPEDVATASVSLAGAYCWIFRGATTFRGPTDAAHLEVLLPSSSDQIIDRARQDADALRKRTAGRNWPRFLYQCEASPMKCSNAVDDDGDGSIDCLDPECAAYCREAEVAGCRNGGDDDADGYVDCADPDCRAECAESGLALCRDGVDNDQDRDVDCSDADCAAWCGTAPTPAPECFGEACDPTVGDLVAPESCDRPCADPTDEACLVALVTFCGIEPPSRCADLIDNDGDGLTDATDPDCAG